MEQRSAFELLVDACRQIADANCWPTWRVLNSSVVTNLSGCPTKFSTLCPPPETCTLAMMGILHLIQASLLLTCLLVVATRGLEGNNPKFELPRQERRLYTTFNSKVGNSHSEQPGTKVIEYFEDQKDYHEDEEISNELPTLPKRGLVPQLWPNYTGPPEVPAEEETCNTARMKCAYRAGCGLAIQNYMLACSNLVEGKTEVCSTYCQHSLIALMSTHEGKRLMKCNCSDDAFCHNSKRNIAKCEAEVFHATKPDTVVTCSAARWICAADPLCSTALEYYHQYCMAMFKGKKCTKRCLNAIHILKKQNSASKLEHCICDGTEDFQCQKIKDNMESLCFKQPDDDILSNEIDGSSKGSASHSSRISALLIAFMLFLSVIFNLVLESVTGSEPQD